MKYNLSSAVKTTKNVITANSPVLLVGTAIAGVVATGVLAARGGYKARGIIDEAELEGGELDTVEKVKLTWLCYAAPAITGASTIASVIGVHTIHSKRNAALAGLYAVATSKLDSYQEKAEEMLGAKKSQQLRDAIAQEAVDENPLKDEREIMLLRDNRGTELCYDTWSGRYFMGSMPIIDRAIAEFNLLLNKEGSAELNEFYEALGLSPVEMGLKFGWDGPQAIAIDYGQAMSLDGRPCISISFSSQPKDLVKSKA